MKKIKVYVGTGKVDSTVTTEIEVEDNATNKEIRDMAWEAARELIGFCWEEVD